MGQLNILSSSSSLTIIIIISLVFVVFGVLYSKKYQGLDNYLVANRDVGVFSLTTSLVASALGAWILFGPASAATWGGIGAVIGYAIGTAFPLFILVFLGKKFRKLYPKGKTLIEVVRLRFGTKLFKLILFLTIFYMFIFLIAEVTAVSILVNYISGTTLWITALIVIVSSLTYTLYGGLRASIFTDNIQFIVISVLLLISFSYLVLFNSSEFNFEFIKKNKPALLSFDYLANFTAGLTFFIAVAATNLFHQGNWQRVYAAKNNNVLKKSLVISFLIIIPIVFFMGFSGLVAVSISSNVVPDLAFFSLLLKEQTLMLSVAVIVLAISLTISSIDTLINAISSLIIVDGKKVLNFKVNYLKLSKYFIIILSLIAFFIASKGLSILYLFLLADLFCCSAVLTVFYSFYDKKIDEKNAYRSILIGLFFGLILFPTTDFSHSILIGILFPVSNFPLFMSESLLFLSFLFATFLPILTWKLK
ncbi:MAG TPA: sodium:solute symporter [Candidatus Pelagibacter bacterium]|jgi:Na+/proline symporter|nr:sodium:solute symporter [Candidatus Pelagibacter bacterium]|tara:strand:+ start:3401 stop:4831 length:1431 start_codon:yes stop_codon:yes gene_type:complete